MPEVKLGGHQEVSLFGVRRLDAAFFRRGLTRRYTGKGGKRRRAPALQTVS